MKGVPAAALGVTIVAACTAALAQDSRSLPDAEELFAKVRANLLRAETVTHLYAFKERRTDVHTNPFGRLGTGGTSLFEVYPSATRRLTYRRLIARNGVPLSAEELADQDRRYRERVAEVQRESAAPSADDRRLREEAAARRRSERIDDTVGTLQFRIERRGAYQGMPAIVISFTPNPEARPVTRYGRTAQKFGGTVWVDEAAAEVMRIEAVSIDDLSFGFGMVARLGKGTSATVTRRPVDGGVWLPTDLTLTGRGRAAIVRRLVIDYKVEWFDYRRLPGDSPTPFLDSRVYGEPGGSPQ